MAIFNRIVLFLIMILAVAAAVFSYLLFQNRNAMRDRADLLAETVVDMTQSLDKGSQTDVAAKVSFEPRIPEAGEDDSGTLSWATFLEGKEEGFSGYINTLKAAEKLAENVAEQRNMLAKSLAEIGQTLGSQMVDIASTLNNATKLEAGRDAARRLESLANAVRRRDLDMIDGYKLIASLLDVNLMDNAFSSRKENRDDEGNVYYGEFEHAGQIARLTETVESTVNRVNDYSEALAGVIRRTPEHDWSVSPFAVADKTNYQRALTSMINDLEAINTSLLISKQREQQIAELQQDLQNLERQLAERTKERDELARKVASLEEQTGYVASAGKDENQGPIMLPKDMEGNVVYANQEFGFIIMDLGTQQQIRNGVEMLVARNGDFVARAVVTEVAAGQAVAELTPSALVDMARVGDRVIPAPEFVK